MKWTLCTRCGWKTRVGRFVKKCLDCGALTEFEYDRAGAKIYDSENPLERYFDLLPLTDRANIRWLRDGNTPAVHAVELAKALKMECLWLKLEGENPSGSTKDRAFSVVYSYFAECQIREFGMCSTGNSSTACGRGAQHFPDEFTPHVFIGREFLNRLNFADSDNVRVYVVEGDFVDAGVTAQDYCEKNGILWEGGFFNPARRAGHKLAYLEALDAMDRKPVWAFQAVSSGMGMIGAKQGFLDYLALGKIERMPRLVAVQQARCSPMVKAWEEGALAISPRHVIENPNGLAKALLRGNPTGTYPIFRHVLESTNGTLCSVTDVEIVEAKWLALACQGLDICSASAVGLAGMIKLRRQGVIKPDQPVLVNLTGRDRVDTTVPTRYTTLSVARKPAKDAARRADAAAAP
jgi:threonine synthase